MQHVVQSLQKRFTHQLILLLLLVLQLLLLLFTNTFVLGNWAVAYIHIYMQRKEGTQLGSLFLDFNSGSWEAWGWCILVGAAACSIPSHLSLLGLSLLGKREQITHLLWAQRQLIYHTLYCNSGMISSFLSPSLPPAPSLLASLNCPRPPPHFCFL